MRLLTPTEIEVVNGGLTFVEAVAFGGGVGTVVGGVAGALAYPSAAAAAIVAGQGAALGAAIGGIGYAGYALGNALGADELGRAIGSELAKGGS